MSLELGPPIANHGLILTTQSLNPTLSERICRLTKEVRELADMADHLNDKLVAMRKSIIDCLENPGESSSPFLEVPPL